MAISWNPLEIIKDYRVKLRAERIARERWADSLSPTSLRAEGVFPTVVPFFQQGRDLPAPLDFKRLSDDGYRKATLVYACVRELARTAAEPDYQVLAIDSDMNETVLDPRSNALASLIKRPNPDQDSFEFYEQLVTHLYVAGNAFCWKIRPMRGGAPVELHLIRPDIVGIVPGVTREDGKVKMFTVSVNGKKKPIPAEDIIHIKLPDALDEFWGLSPLFVAARQADMDFNAVDFLRAFFLNRGVPAGILTLDAEVGKPERERLRDTWREQFQGDTGWHTIAVLDAAAKYQALASGVKDMDLSEIFKHAETRIPMVFGVPPILIGAAAGLERSTFSNTAEARTSFWIETVSPLYTRISQRMTMGLAEEFDPSGSTIIRADTSDVGALQEDVQVRRQFALDSWRGGAFTRGQFFDMIDEDIGDADPNVVLLSTTQVYVPVDEATNFSTIAGDSLIDRTAQEATEDRADNIVEDVDATETQGVERSGHESDPAPNEGSREWYSERSSLDVPEGHTLVAIDEDGNEVVIPGATLIVRGGDVDYVIDIFATDGTDDDDEDDPDDDGPDDDVDDDEMRRVAQERIADENRRRAELVGMFPSWFEAVNRIVERSERDEMAELGGCAVGHETLASLVAAQREAHQQFVDADADSPEWLAIHRAADGGVDDLIDAWFDAINDTLATVDRASLSAAVDANDINRATASIDWEGVGAPTLEAALDNVIGDVAEDAANASLTFVPISLIEAVAPDGIEFDVNLPRHREAITSQIADLVTNITDDQRRGISRAIEAVVDGRVSITNAVDFIESTVGLNERQVQALTRLAVVLTESEVTNDEFRSAIENATDRMRRFRAELIARTETIDAATRGQAELWQQLEDAGILEDTDTVRFWVVTPDDRLDQAICAPVPSLNPEGRRLNEPFVTPVGPVMAPTLHPLCRCAVSLVFLDVDGNLLSARPGFDANGEPTDLDDKGREVVERVLRDNDGQTPRQSGTDRRDSGVN